MRKLAFFMDIALQVFADAGKNIMARTARARTKYESRANAGGGGV